MVGWMAVSGRTNQSGSLVCYFFQLRSQFRIDPLCLSLKIGEWIGSASQRPTAIGTINKRNSQGSASHTHSTITKHHQQSPPNTHRSPTDDYHRPYVATHYHRTQPLHSKRVCPNSGHATNNDKEFVLMMVTQPTITSSLSSRKSTHTSNKCFM